MGMSAGGGEDQVLSDINVTPMVDVMLVLLIIFMVVTPTIVAGFQAQLPEGEHLKARPEKEERTMMGIDAEGAYYLKKKAVPGCTAADRAAPAGKQACIQRFLPVLTAELQSHPDDKVLFVKADKGLPYQELMDAMDLGRKAGFRVLAAVSEGKPGAKEEDLEKVTDETE